MFGYVEHVLVPEPAHATRLIRADTLTGSAPETLEESECPENPERFNPFDPEMWGRDEPDRE